MGYQARLRVARGYFGDYRKVIVPEETVCNPSFGHEITTQEVWDSMSELGQCAYKKLGPFAIDLEGNTEANRLKLVSGDIYVGILDTAGYRNGPGMHIN